jgi:hypothetical protein
MKKKNVISPLFTQPRRSCDTPAPPTRMDSCVCQTVSYDDASAFTHASASSAMASRTAALPVWVRRNTRSGVWRFRAHAVRPAKGGAAGWDSVMPQLSPERRPRLAEQLPGS